MYIWHIFGITAEFLLGLDASSVKEHNDGVHHVRVLEPKQYTYIPQLLLHIFEKRISSEGTVDQRIGLSSEDPRRIAPNIAAIHSPSVKTLVEIHQSRF